MTSKSSSLTPVVWAVWPFCGSPCAFALPLAAFARRPRLAPLCFLPVSAVESFDFAVCCIDSSSLLTSSRRAPCLDGAAFASSSSFSHSASQSTTSFFGFFRFAGALTSPAPPRFSSLSVGAAAWTTLVPGVCLPARRSSDSCTCCRVRGASGDATTTSGITAAACALCWGRGVRGMCMSVPPCCFLSCVCRTIEPCEDDATSL
mmetsp:Transcript_42739/g.96617  ORF Transcript_42739/g.96617 Transcript_42739/m.96617 type:complete len:204 (+) Transcript_42739:652-1263(+)